MALQSQAPRSGGPRRYTSNSRRKNGLTPWLVLLGVVVIVGGLIVLFSGGEDPLHAADPDPPGDSAGASSNAPAPDSQTPGATGAAAIEQESNAQPPAERATEQPPASSGQAATTNTHVTPDPREARQAQLEQLTRSETQQLLGETKDQYETGLQQLEAGNIAVGRALLSELLFRDGALPRHEARAVRERLSFINESTVFSKKLNADQIAKDPILSLHKVQSGEYLSTIGNTYRLPYQLIERINNVEARRLQAGQGLQVIKGPIHARIDKSDYRMDLYVNDPDGVRIYLKSYIVGLGEFDSTPIGKWRIKPGSKVGPANGGPSWVNPRTGERFDRNDPNIPIGEYWMALEGIDENTKGHKGYGIHATNDQESIGRQESMGCVRMRDADVDEVFYTLFEGASVVEIVP